MKLAKWMLVAALAAGTAGSAFALGGSGSPDDPYTIGSYADLLEFAQVVDGTHAALAQNRSAWAVVTNDIAATETKWTPIGTSEMLYNGTFDGAGHTISGLENEGTPTCAGLFGKVDSDGVVRNVRLEGVSFQGDATGEVAGYNGGTVSNCCVSGSVWGSSAGGVVGMNDGTVANCFNTGTVSSYENGSVVENVGGVVGFNEIPGKVVNCHSTGTVQGGDRRGGVAGMITSGTVANSYCPDNLGVEAIGSRIAGTVAGCEVLPAAAYTNATSFSGWDFDDVWAMGPAGPELRAIGMPLWVGGTRVSHANAGDILGDGSAWFEGGLAGGTLVLSNAVVAGTHDFGGSTATIYAGTGFDLTISLAGSNWVANAASDGYGIYAENNLEFVGSGSLAVRAGTGGIHVADGALSLNGKGRVEAVATATDGVAVCGEGGIYLTPWLVVTEPLGGGISDDRMVIADRNGNPAARAVLEPLVAYPLWVGGVQVFSTNALDVLGDGTVRFAGTETNGTLALSNATVTGTHRTEDGFALANIFADSGFYLTISLEGTNRVSNTEGIGVRARDSYLVITGGGVLDVEGTDTWGICADGGSITIHGATVFAKGDHGMDCNLNLTISNATVVATGTDSFGICATGTSNRLDIVDSTVTAMGRTCGLYSGGELSVAGTSVVTAERTGDTGEAIRTSNGTIAIGAGLAVVVPAGGKTSDDGTTIVDANGDRAPRVEIAPRLFTVTVVDGSPTNTTARAGETVTVTAKDPKDGEAFVQWAHCDGVDFGNASAATTTFRMPARDVTVTAVFKDILIDAIPDQEWTGSAVEPAFKVYLDGVDQALQPGSDYTVSFTNNVDPGTATATVTMAPPRTGSASATFTILPPPEPPSVSNVVARQRWPWNGLVDVDYEVGGSTNLLAGLEARISFAASDGRSWVATNFLAGAEPSAAPGFHRATWDTAADGATNVVAAEVVATVELVRPHDMDVAAEPSAVVLPDTARLAVRSDGRDVTGWCTFESDDESVARVDEDGVATATGPGTCEIRVAYVRTDGTTLRGAVALRVEAPTVLDADDPDPIPVDARSQLHVRYAGADVTGDCSFASGDDGIASVDEDGFVTGVSAGTAEITVTYRPEKPGYPESVEATVSVTVE